MSTDLETNLQIIEEFTQRLQVAVIGAEETTNKHVDWVEGPVDGTIDTANGPLKTLRGQIAEWRLAADQDVASAINDYDTQFAAALTQFQNEFDAYLITVGIEPAVEYAAGILIERRAQTVAYNGVTYYWTAVLPYTTTGDFGTELSWQIAPIIGGIESPTFTFASGGKLLRKTQSVLGLDGEWYYWTGTFPKTIAAAATLESAGGVGENLFKISSGFPPLRPTLKLLSTSIGMELNVGSFEGGATLTAQDEVLAQFLTGKLYKWNGAFPKVVDLFSTPSGSGGISPTGWSEIEKSSNWTVSLEALRRSYAEAGYNVVGTFQAGFTIVNANDVGIDETTGKGFTGPAGPVAAGTNPASGGFVDQSASLALPSLLAASVKSIRLGCGLLVTAGFNTEGVGGDSYIYNAALSSGAKAGANPEFVGADFVLYDANGRAYKRIYSKKCHPECFGFAEGVDCVSLLEKVRDHAYANGGGDIGPQFDGTVFSVSRRFDLDGGVDMTGTFEFRHLGNQVNPENRILNVRSRPSGEFAIGPLAAGQITISLANASSFSVGEFVLVLAGRDPYDVNEERVRYFAQVRDNSGGALTLSVACPMDTGSLQPTAGNRIVKFARINIGTKIGNIHFSREGGGLIDIGLIEQWNIGLDVGVITSNTDDFTLVQQVESFGTEIAGVSRAYAPLAFSSGGRLLAGWGCSGAKVGFIRGTSANTCVFTESWNDLTIDSVEIATFTADRNTVFAQGGSTVKIRNVVSGASGASALHLYDNNGGNISADSITLSGASRVCLVRGAKRLKDASGLDLKNVVEIYRLVELPTSGTTDIRLGYGVFTELSILPLSLTGLGTVYCGEDAATGSAINIRSSLTTEGRFNKIESFSRFGTDYPGNRFQLKRLVVTTSGGPASNYMIVSAKCLF